jgi:hypothetical protein
LDRRGRNFVGAVRVHLQPELVVVPLGDRDRALAQHDVDAVRARFGQLEAELATVTALLPKRGESTMALHGRRLTPSKAPFQIMFLPGGRRRGGGHRAFGTDGGG